MTPAAPRKAGRNNKSEIRISKNETNQKFEFSKFKTVHNCPNDVIRSKTKNEGGFEIVMFHPLEFETSEFRYCFVFRISRFGLIYFPMQNREKILSSKSSSMLRPVI